MLLLTFQILNKIKSVHFFKIKMCLFLHITCFSIVFQIYSTPSADAAHFEKTLSAGVNAAHLNSNTPFSLIIKHTHTQADRQTYRHTHTHTPAPTVEDKHGT